MADTAKAADAEPAAKANATEAGAEAKPEEVDPDPVVVKLIARLTDRTDSLVRKAAVGALPKAAGKGNAAAIRAVSALLEDPDSDVRKAAMDALPEMALPGGKVAMIEVTTRLKQMRDKRKANATEVEAAAEANPEAMDPMVAALTAISGFAQEADDSAFAEVIACLEDNDLHVKKAALDALPKIVKKGNDSAIAAVSKCLEDEDEDPAVRVAAVHALTQISGKQKKKNPPEPTIFKLGVDTVDVQKITNVDVVNQHFEGAIHIGLHIKDAFADADLKRFTGEYKKGFSDEVKNSTIEHPDGSLHPSAAWYLSNIVFPNAVTKDLEIEELSVHPPYGQGKTHMMLWIKIKGEFLEVMEMQDFPFDKQALTFTFGSTCRKTGRFPVEFIVADEEKLKKNVTLQPDGIELVGSEYNFSEIQIASAECGAGNRLFPRLFVMVMVTRKPMYAIVNFMLPNFFLVCLSFLQFAIPLEEFVADRVAISLTLLLTAAAYRFAITTTVPAVSYLTMLDHYVLACSIFIILMVIESGVVVTIARIDDKAAELLEFATMIALLVLFAVFHAWFAWKVYKIQTKPKDPDLTNLKDYEVLTCTDLPVPEKGRWCCKKKVKGKGKKKAEEEEVLKGKGVILYNGEKYETMEEVKAKMAAMAAEHQAAAVGKEVDNTRVTSGTRGTSYSAVAPEPV
jgi:hypothetical protein